MGIASGATGTDGTHARLTEPHQRCLWALAGGVPSVCARPLAAGWAATPGVRVVTGDFNGDGRADVGLIRQEAGWGTVPVALSPTEQVP